MTQFQATKSPCCSCPRPADYPECRILCQPVNSYLISLGDHPHKKPQKNLDKLYPPQQGAYTNKYKLTTEAECAAASKKIQDIKKQTSWQNWRIAREVGISETVVACLLRNGQKKMDKGRYERIMEYENE